MESNPLKQTMDDYRLEVIWKGRRCQIIGGNLSAGWVFISALEFEGMKAHRVNTNELTNPELISKK